MFSLCLPLHIHNHDENVLKHVLFYVHDINVMIDEIDLIKYFVLSNCDQTKTRKLLLTRLKTKHKCPILHLLCTLLPD